MSLPKIVNPLKAPEKGEKDGGGGLAKGLSKVAGPLKRAAGGKSGPAEAGPGGGRADQKVVDPFSRALGSGGAKAPPPNPYAKPAPKPPAPAAEPPRAPKEAAQGPIGRPITLFRDRMSQVLPISVASILVVSGILLALIFATGYRMELGNVLEGIMVCVLALLFGVVIMDNIVAYSNESKKKSDERKAILRRDKIISPIVAHYRSRMQSMITPKDLPSDKPPSRKPLVKDLRDMYAASDNLTDVGKSRIETYAHYQGELNRKMTSLVEDVDFDYYEPLCAAAMRFITATEYGGSALEAALGYQSAQPGVRPMKSIIAGLIRDEPEAKNFGNSEGPMRNIHLLHLTIVEQAAAVDDYERIINQIKAEKPAGRMSGLRLKLR
ncbi:MAG: hypothetical protein LBG62_04655 [Candidatus Methanoplasma sp.]|nr:hypothetical protein [Candidatus Methanoplasma sp.]